LTKSCNISAGLVSFLGAKEPPKRWEMCANVMEQHFGYALGAMFWETFEEREEITKKVGRYVFGSEICN
jgi:hypothetical protein